MKTSTRSLFVYLLLAIVVVATPACAKKDEGESKKAGTSGNEVVAYVYDTPITLAEVEEKAASELKKLEQQRFDLLAQALDAMAAEKMVEKEAAERGVTPEAFMQAEIADKVPEPSREEVVAFYEANKERAGGRPLEDVDGQIVRMLKQAGMTERQSAFFAELKAKSGYRVMLDPPRAIVVIPEAAPAKGPADAPITIVEFADFQCPYCRRAHPTMAKLLLEYGDKIRYVFMDYPLEFHPQAGPASVAAKCAGEQDKYWEYHDNLMIMKGDLSPQDLTSRAQQLELDMEAFGTCVTSGKYEPEVQAAFLQGKELGVTGTPSYFINGRMVVGAVPYEKLKETVEDELARASKS